MLTEFFIMRMGCGVCEVGPEFLCMTHMKVYLQRVFLVGEEGKRGKESHVFC